MLDTNSFFAILHSFQLLLVTNMDLASIRIVVLGTFSFMVFWILAVFPSFKLLPIGRTAGALAGAVLTVVFKVESPGDAYAAVDLSILGLLFGTMIVSVYLEKADMFRYLGNMLSWKSQGGKDLLCRLCILSAILSALFTNDTCCLVLTEFVLKLCRQKNLPSKPFLIALATSSNLGSVVTPIGNPQNLIIAVQSGISFGSFLLGLLPSMVLGVLINTALLLLAYWTQLSPVEKVVQPSLSSTIKEQPTAAPWTPFYSGSLLNLREAFEAEVLKNRLNGLGLLPPGETSQAPTEGNRATSIDYVSSSNFVPICEDKNSGTPNHNDGDGLSPLLPASGSKLQQNHIYSWFLLREKISLGPRWKRRLWKSSVYFVAASMLAAFLYGLDLSWTALTAGVTLMALDFSDAGPRLEQVSYPLLVFFAGMFITVDGFNKTGIPSTFWGIVEPQARITYLVGEIILTLVIIILSNVASNVPTVLLMGSRVAQSAASSGASVSKAWLILAWASTVGGNLTLVGSAANLIVSEQAAKARLLGFDLNFFSHLVFGFPSTLIIALSGLFLIRG